MEKDVRRERARLARENARLAEERARLEKETARLRLELDRHATEREASRRAVEEAGEARSRFAASVSHELRTPLNAILGYVELMEKGIPVPLPPEMLTYVERVATSARYAVRLVEGIVDLSRLEAGRDTLELRPVALSEIVQGVEAVAHPLAHDAGIEFRTRVPDEPVVVDTDPRKLQRIVVHLVRNAVKFTERGSVTLTVASGESEVRIEVADTGVGIPEGELERIFEPFHKLRTPPRASDAGPGLGLPIVRELVRLLGARLEISSREGEGTRFILYLPHRPNERSVASPPRRW